MNTGDRSATRKILRRLGQVDEFNWNGAVYATTYYTYNALDQMTQINQGPGSHV
jgi:hypothetical protein